jgi:hypothetical protein
MCPYIGQVTSFVSTEDTSSYNAPQGILQHGFGRWKPIVDDTQLDLKTQLRLELASKRALDAPAGSAAPAAGAPPPADGAAGPSEQPAAGLEEAGPSTADAGDVDSGQVRLSFQQLVLPPFPSTPVPLVNT